MAAQSDSPYAFYAFYQLYQFFEGAASKEYTFKQICQSLYPDQNVDSSERVSIFITWKRKHKHQHQHAGTDDGFVLRGCIGTFAKIPLTEAIKKYSLYAAMQDTRFPPIAAKELSSLKCSCNLLQNFKTIYSAQDKTKTDIYDWEIGKHGIELKFKHPKTGSIESATFLPDVMTEQEWDKKTTFLNLIEKAGCWAYATEIINNCQDYFVQVIRYEGNKTEIGYHEFKEKLNELGS